MSPETTCTVTVRRDNTVTLEFEVKRYQADLQHRPLTRDIVRRLDSLITRIPQSIAQSSSLAPSSGYEKEDLKLLGAVLFDILFGGQARKVVDDDPSRVQFLPLNMTLGALLDGRLKDFENERPCEAARSFRICLSLEDDTWTLSTYPWEFLFVEREADQGFFLGEKVILTRVLNPLPALRACEGALQVWLAWSQPGELGQISGVESLPKTIKTAFGLGAVEITEIKEVTFDTLLETLRAADRAPDILHLVSHGQLHGDVSEIAFRRSPEQLREARERAGPQPQEDVKQADWVAIKTIAAALGHERLRDRRCTLVCML